MGQPRDAIDERERRIRELEEELERERAELQELEEMREREEVVRRVEDIDRLRGAEYSTWFKAAGTMGDLRDMLGVQLGESPELLDIDIDDFEDGQAAAPAAFYSQQILGQVKWDGIVEEERIIEELNMALQFIGEEKDGFDFREVYDEWAYRWFVVERIGGIDFIVAEGTDSRRR